MLIQESVIRVVDSFERRVCELEGGKGAVACSSGMSAVTLALLNILEAGDEIIAGSGLFGGTIVYSVI